MEKFNVYVVEKSYNDYTLERKIIEKAGARLLFVNCRKEEDIIHQCENAHALLLRQTPVGERTFQKLTQLRVIARYGIGYDNINVRSATRHGVLITIVPDYCVSEVADHTIALLMAAIRRIPLRDRLVRSGIWDVTSQYPVNRTTNKTLGLVGYGKTAREVRKRLSGFPYCFVACDPHVSKDIFSMDNTLQLDFHTLITVSHYISIHVPLNESTQHLFNLHTFRKMKRGSILINTSRGKIVDTNALYTALKEGFISGAALDVYESEPFDTESPLAQLNSVVLSDHAAWYSEESQRELQIRTAFEVARVLYGEPPANPVNPEVLDLKMRIIQSKNKVKTKILKSIENESELVSSL